jgi:hypothetical protein
MKIQEKRIEMEKQIVGKTAWRKGLQRVWKSVLEYRRGMRSCANCGKVSHKDEMVSEIGEYVCDEVCSGELWLERSVW